MADPTPTQLQSQIDELRSLITTEYQPLSTDEYSYPVVGQPMNDEMWQYVTLANGDGILDEGGRPYWLRSNGTEANTNSTNTMLLTVSTTTGNAQSVMRGFYHRLMQDKVLTFPAVLSNTTYYVVLRYDPLGHNEEGGPISAQVVTSLDRSLGKHYVVLWKGTRRPNQLLSEVTFENLRQKVTPTIQADTREQLPDPQSVLWGTLAVITSGRQGAEIIRAGGTNPDGGPSDWVSLTDPPFTNPGDTAAYVYAGHGYRRGARLTPDGYIELRGHIARGDGSDFSRGNHGYQMYDLSGWPSGNNQQFVTVSTGYSPPAIVKIEYGSDQTLRAYPINRNCSWINLDGIRIYVGAQQD